MNVISLLREVIAIELSKTSLGDDTHYFVQSRDNIHRGLQQALAHLAKILALNNDRSVNKWSGEVISHLIDVNESALWKKWSYANRKNKWQEIGDDIELIYSGMRKKFELKRDLNESRGIKNQVRMPVLDSELKSKIQSHWDMLFDKFLDGTEDDFIKSLKT